MVTIVTLAITTVGFFVAFAVFYGKYSDRGRLLQQAQTDAADIVKPEERNRDDIQSLVAEAKKDGNKSLVGYLVGSQGAIMERVTGARSDRLSSLATKLGNVQGADSANLLTLVANRDSELAALRSQLAQADAARAAALKDLENEVGRVGGIEQRHQETVNALTAEVQQYRAEIETYRLGTDQYKQNLDARLGQTTNSAAEERKRLQDQLTSVSNESAILKGQLQTLRADKANETLAGSPEVSLVDGTVIGIGSGQAFIGIGSRQKVSLGMTFTVYADATALRPDAEGNYPRGKATLEVISVDDNSSTCRITSEVRGNPVVRGDVIANAIYDPTKVYKFVVFGNFDADRDGLPTAQERQTIAANIASWGGSVTDEIAGDTDFLVLGERPILPPNPSSDAPLPVVEEFIRRRRDVERYDALYAQARSTNLPVINENRLYTLTGTTPAAARR